LQVAQRRIARPEVVEDEPDAELADREQLVRDVLAKDPLSWSIPNVVITARLL